MVLWPDIIGCKLMMVVCHRNFCKAGNDGLGVLAVGIDELFDEALGIVQIIVGRDDMLVRECRQRMDDLGIRADILAETHFQPIAA